MAARAHAHQHGARAALPSCWFDPDPPPPHPSILFILTRGAACMHVFITCIFALARATNAYYSLHARIALLLRAITHFCMAATRIYTLYFCFVCCFLVCWLHAYARVLSRATSYAVHSTFDIIFVLFLYCIIYFSLFESDAHLPPPLHICLPSNALHSHIAYLPFMHINILYFFHCIKHTYIFARPLPFADNLPYLAPVVWHGCWALFLSFSLSS